MSKHLKSTFIIFLLFNFSLHAQITEEIGSDTKNIEIGFELQIYPTGIIPGLRIEKYLSDKSSINIRLGYQIIDHRDLGKHEDETGSGFGISLAYRKFFNSVDNGFSLAFRTDYWVNEIDWIEGLETGTTNIKVIQPTLMGEYIFHVGERLTITPSLTAGWEWNAKTDGQDTGEGAIILIGATFGIGI